MNHLAMDVAFPYAKGVLGSELHKLVLGLQNQAIAACSSFSKASSSTNWLKTDLRP